MIVDREIHDGLGGKHKLGDMPTLPPEVAKLFIERGFAEFVET
jgi:hypothetical protein